MKHIVPTQRYDNIEINLLNFDKKTGFSLFKLKFNGFIKTELYITGDTFTQIYKNMKIMINDKGV